MPPNQSISIADEVRKLAELKEEGIITETNYPLHSFTIDLRLPDKLKI